MERASAFLLLQAEQQFAEVRHVMKFSRAAGFTGTSEEQSGDIFARATLAHLLLDIAGLTETAELASALRGIAQREAQYIADAKIVNRAGGWSYFPDLPELPPDADSLAAALSLFVRIAPEYTPLCRQPVELVLAGANADGSFETWIVAPEDAPFDRARMQWAMQNCWGGGADPDVLAHLYYALWLWEPARYGEAIRSGASKLIEMQQPNGSWRATWYVGPAYGTGLAVRLLQKIGMGDQARERAYRFLVNDQREDGAWGDENAAPLQTALSMSAVRDAQPGSIPIQIVRGASALRARQQADGSWVPSPWIQMEIGRATGKILRVATYQSATLTTAFCLRALLLAGSPSVMVTAP
jgi:squalene-hopene/tetraprenyl-beta-curcumene cyclase